MMIEKPLQFLRSLFTNVYFGAGLLLVAVLVCVGYLAVDRWLMPSYVRHDIYVSVPDVAYLPVEEAEAHLQSMDFRVEVESNRYNPQYPRDVVLDQNPDANVQVKPGRRIYLTINTGTTPESTVPTLVGVSLREALNRLNAAGLIAEDRDIRPDSIPHPYLNVVTKQFPEPGTIADEGSRVQVWYSTGPGTEYANVPAVTGMRADEASQFLLDRRLRSVILGGGAQPELDVSQMEVIRQSPEQGTRIKEGSEIRLFVEADREDDEPN